MIIRGSYLFKLVKNFNVFLILIVLQNMKRFKIRKFGFISFDEKKNSLQIPYRVYNLQQCLWYRRIQAVFFKRSLYLITKACPSTLKVSDQLTKYFHFPHNLYILNRLVWTLEPKTETGIFHSWNNTIMTVKGTLVSSSI